VQESNRGRVDGSFAEVDFFVIRPRVIEDYYCHAATCARVAGIMNEFLAIVAHVGVAWVAAFIIVGIPFSENSSDFNPSFIDGAC
jgi:hypothetical protein